MLWGQRYLKLPDNDISNIPRHFLTPLLELAEFEVGDLLLLTIHKNIELDLFRTLLARDTHFALNYASPGTTVFPKGIKAQLNLP